jgi:hypothetical protein
MGQWDEKLIIANFLAFDVDTILATPIRDDFADFYAWHYDTKGLFTVKSMYKLYVAKRDGPQQSTSGQGNEVLNWDKIWKLAYLNSMCFLVDLVIPSFTKLICCHSTMIFRHAFGGSIFL